MVALKIALVLALLFCLVQWTTASQQCAALHGTPLEGCSAAGYNTTFPFPETPKLNDRSKMWIRRIIAYIVRSMENCSVAQMGESVICSEFAPYCREQDSGPFLPCRRVCSEYLKRCDGTIDRFWLEYTMSACTLLPNLTADSGKCYEPPGFYKYHNTSTKGLLEGGCNPVLFPMCKGVGYDHTITTQKTQLRMYKLFYSRNFTNSSDDKIIPTGSIVRYWTDFFANYSKCAGILRKLFCADLFPPCFPEEGLAFYTLCQPVCEQIVQQCPDIHKSSYGNYVTICEMTATGNTSHGFCKHTSWPPPLKWLQWFKDRPKPQPTSKPPGVKVYVVVIAVIVPIVVVAVIIGSILIWRQRKLPTFFMVRGSDDREELVT